MSDSAQTLDGYSYIECRDLRHAWTVQGWYMGADDRMRRRLLCLRCRTVRLDTYEGWVTRRSYQHPDDYRLDHRPSREEIIEGMLRDAKVYLSEQDLEEALRRHDQLASRRERRRKKAG